MKRKPFFALVILFVITAFSVTANAGPQGSGGDDTETPPGDRYTVISWNISKNDAQNKEIKRLVRRHRPDLFCLQEATSRTCKELQADFNCHFAPSWKMPDSDVYNGVLTASRLDLQDPARFESPDREFLFFTTKAAMVSTIALNEETELMVINVHLLNFVGLDAFGDQLREIYRYARAHTGPMILCGDVNTWNSARLKIVHQYAARLGMVEALAFHKSGGTPSKWTLLIDPFIEIHQGALLDRMFCRGFEVLECKRLSGYTSSDHPPMLLRARLLD